jgi:hypothetical protein
MSNARFCIIPARALGDKRLNRTDIMVLNALGMFGDKQGWCFPSIGRIAEMIDAHRTSVSKAISNLIACGYVESRQRYREDGGQTSNEYRILFDAPASQGSFDLESPQLPEQDDTPPVAVSPPPYGETTTPPIAPEATPPVAHTPHLNNDLLLTPHSTATHKSAGAGEMIFYERAFEAGCIHHPPLRHAMSSSIHQWYIAGCDFELDVLPEIKRHEGKHIMGWSYFTPGIMDAIAVRTSKAPESRKGKKSSKKEENPPPDEHSIARSYAWFRDRGLFLDTHKQIFLDQYEEQHGKIEVKKPSPDNMTSHTL